MTYARGRLWTGILAVGFFVLLAVLFLSSGRLGEVLQSRGGSTLSDFGVLWLVLGAAALLALPFDITGGYALPKRCGRPHPPARAFAAIWLRAIGAIITVQALIGTGVLASARAGGWFAGAAAFVASLIVLALVQERLARLVGGLRRVGSDHDHIVLRGSDPAFAGGFAGPGGRVVLPEAWIRTFPPSQLETLLERRRSIRSSGAFLRAAIAAILWNSTGFLLASLLPGAGFESVGALVHTSLWFTLWTFLGLLVLPTPSRRATYAMDALSDREELGDAIRMLDRLQDDEPERAPGVEAIFHPIPSVTGRLAALRRRRPRGGAFWNLARTTLYLANAGLTVLPRSVHCNAGRPELWVYLPADG